MDRRLRLAMRELDSLRSEKTIVLAIIIQLFIAAFSSFLVVGLVSLSDPGSTAGSYDVSMGISGEARDELQRIVETGDAMEPVVFDDRETAMTAFADRRVDAVIHTEVVEGGRIHADVIVPEGDFRTTLIVTQIKQALSELEREKRAVLTHRLENEPLTVPQQGDSNPYFGFTYTVLIPVLVFLPAFISGSIASDSIAEELERGTLELLRVTPLSIPDIIDGKALTMVAIAPAQAGTWLLLLGLDGTKIVHPFAILVLVTVLTGLLVVLGAALALTIEKRREAQLAFSLLSLGLFGATFLLPENLSNLVAKLAIGSPTVVSAVTLMGITVIAGVGYLIVRNRLVAQVSS